MKWAVAHPGAWQSEKAFERQARKRGEAGPQVAFTVSAGDRIDGQRTSKLAAMHRSIMLLIKSLSLWKCNWKSFGVLIEERISSMLIVPTEKMPNMVPKLLSSFGGRPFTVVMEQPLKRRR
jgi:hypothetical protein